METADGLDTGGLGVSMVVTNKSRSTSLSGFITGPVNYGNPPDVVQEPKEA